MNKKKLFTLMAMSLMAMWCTAAPFTKLSLLQSDRSTTTENDSLKKSHPVLSIYTIERL